jgi:hypothetical protein
MERKAATRFACVLSVLLCAVPAFCQDVEDAALREAGGLFAFGDLFVRDLNRATDPVVQLKTFFSNAGMPITKDQEKSLQAIVEAQQKDLAATLDRLRVEGGPPDTIRKMNQEYMKQVNAVLTQKQQAEWRHYRVEQLKLRGGFASLQVILEEAKVPLSEEQRMSIETIYKNFEERRAQLAADSTSSREKMDNLVLGELHRVSALLTPDQRKAVLATRPVQSPGRTKP